jgi:hypothetical protein
MDLAPLLYVIRVVERSLLLLFCRLLLTISTIFTVSTIPTIYSVDLSIVMLLLPRKPLVMWFKEPGSSLNGDVSDCKQIEHHFRLFVVISSTVLISLTPSWKALMTSISWMYGLAFLVLQKYFM